MSVTVSSGKAYEETHMPVTKTLVVQIKTNPNNVLEIQLLRNHTVLGWQIGSVGKGIFCQV